MLIDKERLLKPHLPEADVEIPGVGTVRVRGLSRAEWLDIRDLTGVEADAKAIAMTLVDPELTEAEAMEWLNNSLIIEAGLVVSKMLELSGLGSGIAKATWKELQSDPDSEFRDASSEGPGDDGGSTPGGDE